LRVIKKKRDYLLGKEGAEALMEEADLDQSGSIEIDEFLAVSASSVFHRCRGTSLIRNYSVFQSEVTL